MLKLPALFPEKEAAEALGISKWTLERARKSGKIKSALIGGRWKYRLEWIEDYVESQACQTTVSKSDDGGSHNAAEAPTGAEPGLTTPAGKPSEPPLAQTISKPPKAS
ncbi:MAG: helix-turn-helix domain-containing protein [Pseudomonadota bacterium]